jgi:hypothetical protein
MRNCMRCFCLALLFLACTCRAAIVRVPGDQPTIQAGVNAAAYGDTVVISDGTYSETNIAMKSGVWVRSSSRDPASVTVSAGYQGRVFAFAGTDGPCGLEGLTITQGYNDTVGGALLLSRSSARIVNCILTHNRCKDPSTDLGVGGAVAIEGLPSSTVAIEDCAFVDNVSNLYSGALHIQGGVLRVTGCSFVGNHTGSYGGAMYSISGDIGIVDCLFRGNRSTDGFGGALHFHGRSCVVSVDRCRFESNQARYRAGAISARWMSSLSLKDSVFIGNSTVQGTGAAAIMLSEGGPVYDIEGCSIVGSGSPDSLCALEAVVGATVTIDASIIAYTTGGGAVSCADGGAVTLSCCDIYGNAGGDWSGCIADQLGVDGNFCADPLFCNLAQGDLTLEDTSPCAPAHSPCLRLVGALGPGCPGTLVDPVTWGRLKALYR